MDELGDHTFDDIGTLSVIMVCRNAAATVDAALASLAVHMKGSWELIVVDGGSTDGTLDRIVDWGKNVKCRLRYRSEPDGGIFDAMNRGLARGRGDWVYFLNADDVFTEGVAAALRELGSARPEVVAVYGGVRFVDVRHGFSERVECGHRKLDFALSRAPHHQGIFMRREAALDAGGFDLSLGSAADLGLIAALRKRGGEGGFRAVDTVVADFALGGVSERPDAWLRRERERARAVGRYFGIGWGALNFAHGITLWVRSWARVALDALGWLAAWRRLKAKWRGGRYHVGVGR